MAKSCSLYFCGPDVYVAASARDVFGIGHDCEPFFKLSEPVSANDLGVKVLQALESHREGVPGKTYIRGQKHPPAPFLVFAGFRSWRAFEKGAKYFLITASDSEIEITPSVHRPQGGYLHKPDEAVRCPAQSDQLGTLLLALATE